KVLEPSPVSLVRPVSFPVSVPCLPVSVPCLPESLPCLSEAVPCLPESAVCRVCAERTVDRSIVFFSICLGACERFCGVLKIPLPNFASTSALAINTLAPPPISCAKETAGYVRPDKATVTIKTIARAQVEVWIIISHLGSKIIFKGEQTPKVYCESCLTTSTRIASQKIYSKWIRCLKLKIYSK